MFRRALRRIAGALADPSPAMRAIATRLADRAEDAFETQASPDGKPWAALKPDTERARKKSGHVPVRILQRSGALVRSILADWSPVQAVAGTNLVYAATHQFGDPERNIPARPFLGASGATSGIARRRQLLGRQGQPVHDGSALAHRPSRAASQ